LKGGLLILEISKQDIKNQNELVKALLAAKGVDYSEWLYEIQEKFINENRAFLIKKLTEKENA
jgi:hypothetical protein